MAVRPGPKIFGEIKNNLGNVASELLWQLEWYCPGLTNRASGSGCRVLEAACFLEVISVVCENHMRAHAYPPHPWRPSINIILGTMKEKEKPHPLSALLQHVSLLRGALFLSIPTDFAVWHFSFQGLGCVWQWAFQGQAGA